MPKLLNFRADPKKLSDAALIKRYQKTSDQDLIVVLMERYVPQISGLAYRYFRDQDDIADFRSDLFEKLVRKLDQVDTAEIRQFDRWLCRLIKNTALDTLRKQQTYRGYTLDFAEAREANPESDRINLKVMDNPHLHTALKTLKEEEQLCIRMIYFEELSYQEVMGQTGFSFNQVRGYRDRAIRRLRSLLQGDFADYFT